MMYIYEVKTETTSCPFRISTEVVEASRAPGQAGVGREEQLYINLVFAACVVFLITHLAAGALTGFRKMRLGHDQHLKVCD